MRSEMWYSQAFHESLGPASRTIASIRSWSSQAICNNIGKSKSPWVHGLDASANSLTRSSHSASDLALVEKKASIAFRMQGYKAEWK